MKAKPKPKNKKKTTPKPLNYKILTKEEVEAGRSKAYAYLA